MGEREKSESFASLNSILVALARATTLQKAPGVFPVPFLVPSLSFFSHIHCIPSSESVFELSRKGRIFNSNHTADAVYSLRNTLAFSVFISLDLASTILYAAKNNISYRNPRCREMKKLKELAWFGREGREGGRRRKGKRGWLRGI